MSAYNYQRISTQIEKTKTNFNRSEQLAVNNGFEVVFDSDAYNGRYFIKDGKKWIHNINALRSQMGNCTDYELVNLGYDVESYYNTH